MIERREAYEALVLMLVAEEEDVRCDCEEFAEGVLGEEADELREDVEDFCIRDILGFCGLARSEKPSCNGL